MVFTLKRPQVKKAKDVILDIRKFEIKAKTKFGMKNPFFWRTLIQADEVQFFFFLFLSYNKIFTPWKNYPFHFNTS